MKSQNNDCKPLPWRAPRACCLCRGHDYGLLIENTALSKRFPTAVTSAGGVPLVNDAPGSWLRLSLPDVGVSSTTASQAAIEGALVALNVSNSRRHYTAPKSKRIWRKKKCMRNLTNTSSARLARQ